MRKSRLAKVLSWRVCSIIITLLTTWAYTGDIKNASTFTIILHLINISAHYSFETLWDRKPISSEKAA